MRPELRIALEQESEDRRTATTTKPPLRIRPYVAVYVVSFTKDGQDVWDGDWKHPIAVFEEFQWEDALDYAQNMVRDREAVMQLAARSPEPVTNPEGLAVSTNRGSQMTFRFPWVPEPRRVSWWLRMFGWR